LSEVIGSCEDHRDLLAADLLHLLLGQRQQITALVPSSRKMLPLSILPGGERDEPQDRQGRDRLAAPALADDRHGRTEEDGERSVAHWADLAARGVEGLR